MNNLKKYLRVPIVLIGVVSAAVALWQFYLFVQFKNTAGQLDPQGGGFNLGLAVVAALIACAAGAYVAFSVVNHEKEDVMHITS